MPPASFALRFGGIFIIHLLLLTRNEFLVYITLHVIYLNSRLKYLVKTWQGLQDREIMIGSLPEVLIIRAERPIGSYKTRETLIRLLRRNKILQILSTKRKISRPPLNQLFPIFLQNVNQYQWSKNVFAFPFSEILFYL